MSASERAELLAAIREIVREEVEAAVNSVEVEYDYENGDEDDED